jgi:predicted ester cyclase
MGNDMTDLKAAREKTVRAHMELENTQDWAGVLATFEHPRYEFQVPMPGSSQPRSVFDGAEQVQEYFKASRSPFPDQSNEIIHLVVEGDIAMVEFWLMGTHLGPIKTPQGDIPPTGRKFKVKMSAVFEFAPGSDKMISERPYVDPRAIQLQLGLMSS